MARGRRRSSRLGGQTTPEPTAPQPFQATASPAGEVVDNNKGEPNSRSGHQDDDDRCPACEDGTSRQNEKGEQESWVRCDACRTWFHWRCAGEGDLDAIDKWFCKPCMEEDSKRVITVRPPARKSSRKRAQRDYAGLHTGQDSDPNRWLRMLEGKTIKPHPFKHMKGNELTVEWLEHDESAMTEPVLIESPEGLGMKMPGKDFTVRDVAETVGLDTPVEVIDVATQSNLSGWTLEKWADYFETEQDARDKIRNVISLEISGTELANKILPPRLVRDVDWVDKFWPSTKKGRGQSYPKVQLYCLMGVAEAWTDWHIDFAGSSVYYHILHGAKVFYFIRPTPSNLAAYEKWSGTEIQNHSWLGDMVDEVFRVDLTEGNTMIIPTGWIHAVYTPVDTLVFGGNFLHSYNVATQLKVRDIEIATHVPKKFRFPFFSKLCWYTAEKYLRDIKAKEEFTPRVLEGIEAVADFLVREVRSIERGSDQAKKEAREQVPHDRVKDAPALARELRWRVRMAGGYTSDDDIRIKRKPKGENTNVNGTSAKRKRETDDEGREDHFQFRNFKPRAWDKVLVEPVVEEKEEKVVQKVGSGEGGWKDTWTGFSEKAGEEGGVKATVTRKRNVIVKVRRTDRGIERHRAERVIEEWVWNGEACGEGDAGPRKDVEMTQGDEKLKDGSVKDEDTKMVVEEGGTGNGET